MSASILEHEPRARDEILDRVGNEDFSCASEPSDSGSDVNGNARELRLYDFALTSVKTRPNVEAHQSNLVPDGLRSPNRPRGSIERGEETVAGSVDFTTMKEFELLSNHRVVLFEERAPLVITEFNGFAGRVYYVCEHHRGKHSIRFRSAPHTREKFFDLVDERVGVARPRRVIVAGYFDVSR